MNHNGLFITFEGSEGSGKSTLVKSLSEELRKKIINKEINFLDVITTREPGGINNPLAEKIRDLILNSKISIPSITEIFLFATSRSAHVQNTIKPNLQENKIILCDRFLDSSIVYQGYAKNIDINIVKEINKHAIQNIYPDLTFYLDLDPEIGLERIKKNNRVTNRFDKENLDFHKKIRNYYNQYFSNINNVVKIDANCSKEELLNKCLKVILDKIKTNEN